MSNTSFSVKIEFLPGSDFDEAAEQAIAFAHKIGVDVTYNFNGCHMFLTEYSSLFAAREQWREYKEVQKNSMRLRGLN